MHIKNNFRLFYLSLFFVANLNSQQLWNELKSVDYLAKTQQLYQKDNFPKSYKVVAFDIDFFKNSMNQKKSSNQQIIELPDAAGKMKRFTIVETSNFEPELQRKFPEIKSFTAKGIDDATSIAKISLGTDGFHAAIFSGSQETVYIDPYTKDNKSYLVYKRSSMSSEEESFKCMVQEKASNKPVLPLSFQKSTNDGKLRTYRLALACSGEYALFHLNNQNVSNSANVTVKKAAVLSAMNTSMTRINGVFEKDLAVKMLLVNNNDNIIFLDPATDNITDNNIDRAISESQSICDSRIGASNYDIGHLLFTSGGELNGLAGLGVVCINGQKARGVTGLGTPIGDIYDIDLIAHEMGHQFGATHTQHNDCNREEITAVEPGSATTIMGYSGICAPNVFGVGSSTGNSDDYFHAVSLAQMYQVIATTGTCAAQTNTNNAAPIANAGANFSIPVSTPFKLTGSATDVDGLNSLTYNWEQIDYEILDNGSDTPKAINSTNIEGPLFRSLPSKTSSIRYFPDLATVVGGSISSQWEVIPSVARELNFALTVRDNHATGGSTSRDDVRISVVNSTPFVITSQQTSTTWNTGSTQTVTWNVGNTFSSPINCKIVNIRLSTDGGVTFPILLKSNTPNDGSEAVVIPNNATTNARIMVEAADNIFYNVNPVNFTINSTVPTFVLTNTSGSKSVCNTANQTVSYTLNFDFVNGFSQTVSLSASGLPNGAQVAFSPNTINADGNVTMTISNLNGVTPQDYVVNVAANSSSINQNINIDLKVTTANFTTLNLVTPSNLATNVPIVAFLSWAENTNATSYDIQIATDNSFNNLLVNTTVTASFYETIALNSTTQYFWRVRPKNDCGSGSFSSAFSFTTKKCEICISSGDTQYDTSTTLVRFNTINNASTKLNTNFVRQGYFNYKNITTNVKRGTSHNLFVNVNTDGNYRVQVKVWIDWNGDCEFNDSNEEYDLGAAANVTNGVTNLSPISITIPANAKLGTTVMRVSSAYTDPDTITYPTACKQSFDGEVEDYSLIVEDATAAIADENFENFNLYPNPTRGEFNIKFNMESSSNVTLQLFDVRGRMVEEKTYTKAGTYFSEKVNIKSLSAGLYLVKIKNGTKQTTRKLMVE